MTDTPFSTPDAFLAALMSLPSADESAVQAAQTRNAQLTKPPGALGRLEEFAIWYSGWRGTVRPRIERPQIVVFAGNHGVADLGVSAFPAAVTAQMVANFRTGGAAINQLAGLHDAGLTVVALDLDRPTADFTRAPAMSPADLSDALSKGWAAVDPAADLLIPGEMGIGNTTSAAAVAASVLGGTGADWIGRGTGVDDEGLARKAATVDAGLSLHAHARADGVESLRCLGGREIAAMTGAMARARTLRIPVLLDGFIAGAAAVALHAVSPAATEHMVAGHLSAEGAHGRMLDALGLEPLLSLGLRLGEGSGAAVALGVLRAALACHSGMATFDEAGVSAG